ncbi:MAG: hypothetical protein LIP02_14855 [Bacteroidales bacterium]|nr:hypothetical protein [Bacteroidales bacterium]
MNHNMTSGEFRGLLVVISLVACAIIAVAIVRGCQSDNPPLTISPDSIQAVINRSDSISSTKKTRKTRKDSTRKSVPKSPRKPINRTSPHDQPVPALP